jgi:pimeloyl-ACP methyl ester carboxylesterase
MYVSNLDANTGYPLQEIGVPVLIVSAVDDPLTLYGNAESAVEWIPGGKLVTIEDGGHLDQAALQGLLRRLYSLGLPLISVICVECGSKDRAQVVDHCP